VLNNSKSHEIYVRTFAESLFINFIYFQDILIYESVFRLEVIWHGRKSRTI